MFYIIPFKILDPFSLLFSLFFYPQVENLAINTNYITKGCHGFRTSYNIRSTPGEDALIISHIHTSQIPIVGIIHSKILVTYLSVDPLQSTMHIISSLPYSPIFSLMGSASMIDPGYIMHLGTLSFGLSTYIEMCFPLTPPLLQSLTGKERRCSSNIYIYICVFVCVCACPNAQKVLIAMTFVTMIGRMSHEITSKFVNLHTCWPLSLSSTPTSIFHVCK